MRVNIKRAEVVTEYQSQNKERKYSNLLNTRYGYIKQHGTQKVDLIKFVMDEIINMAFQ